MKRIVALAQALVAMAAMAVGPGAWEGEIPAAKVPVRINIADDGAVTMDSPKQGAKGIPCEVDCLEGDSLALRIPKLGVELRGRFDADTVLQARFTQGMFSSMMSLAPAHGPRRPQTPKGPFPYATEDFSFTSGEATLAGTLTVAPKGDVAVVMVTGSGPQNRDEEVMEHRPFAVLADHLARNGVSSLRYDDRGVGESTGDFASATTDDFAMDARKAVEALRATGRFGKIGVMGHSEGGRIAWSVAEEADFVIGLGAPAMSGDSILLDQNRALLQAMGAGSAADAYVAALDSVIHGRSIPEGAPMHENLEAVKAQLQASEWMRRFVADDPTADIRAVSVPALAIYGGNDVQVLADRNAASLRWKNPKVQVMVMDGLNHLLQPSESGLPAEYYDIETTIDPRALSVISMWIAFASRK